MIKQTISITKILMLLLFCGASGILNGANQYKVSQVDGGMPYLLHLPEEYAANTGKYYPTLIYLHGWGERCSAGAYGTTSQLSKVENAGNTPPNLIKNGSPMGFMVNGQMEYFIVISPQIKEGKQWNAADVVALLAEVSSQVRIDPNRVSVTGFSFGGEGTWLVLRQAANTPNRFAAAAPVHGSSYDQSLQVVAQNKVAVWNTSGTSDTTIHTPEAVLAGSRNLRQYLPEAEVITTMYENVGHTPAREYSTGNTYHSENLYQWFLRQSLKTPGLAPVNDLTNRTATVVTAGDGASSAGWVKTNPSAYWISNSTNYADKWVMLDLGAEFSVNQIYLGFASSTSAAIKPTAPSGSITSIAASPTAGRIRINSVNHGLQAQNTGESIPGHKVKIKDSTGYNGGSYEVLAKGTDWFDIAGTFTATSTGTWYANSETVKAYRIETSVDGTNWTTLVEELNNYEFNKQHKFTAKPVRYARLKILAANRMALAEFKDISKVSLFSLYEALPPIDPPGAPTGLTVGGLNSGGATLQWTAPAPQTGQGAVAGYRVYWSTGSTRPAVQGATLAANAISYEVTGLLPLTNYNFWVVAYNSGGEAAAPPVTATTLGLTTPLPPTGLTVGGGGFAAGVNGASLAWSDQSNNETGFNVYWNTVAVKPPAPGLQTGASASGALVRNLQPNTQYYFWVTSYNTAGESSAITTNVSTLPPTSVVSSGLVSLWKFSESGGTVNYDTMGFENGTLSGNVSRLSSGRLDKGLQFDGIDDWVEVPHHAEYSATAISVSMWIRPDVVDANPRGLISKRMGSSDASKRCFSIFTNTGNKVWVDIGTQRIDTGYVLTTSSTWKHLVMVFDGAASTNNLRLYMDGVQVSVRTTTATSVPVVDSPLSIGILNPGYVNGTAGNVNGFQGGIDEVRIYNRALAAADVGLLFGESANQAPVANTDEPAAFAEGASLAISVLDNDTDPDNGPSPLSVTSSGGATAHGNVTRTGNIFYYTPNPGYFGLDSFTYTISDGLATAVGTVNVEVTDTSTAPDLTGANLTGANIGNGTGSSRVLANGDWEVNGAGGGMTGVSDGLHGETADLTGDFRMRVQVKSLANNGANPRTGIMLRESNATGARTVWVGTGAGNAFYYGSRTVTDAAMSAENTVAGITASYPNAWLMLERMGNTVQLSVSVDGLTYTDAGTVVLSGLATTVKAGLFSSSGSALVTTRTVMGGYQLSPLPTPLSCWKFNETSGTNASDNTGFQSGTLHGSATWTTGGHLNGGINFTGSSTDWVDMPDRQEYGGTAMSISLWFKPAVLDAQPRGLISKRVEANTERAITAFVHTGNRIFVDIGTQRIDTGYTIASTNVWYHLVVVFDGSLSSGRLKVYVNAGTPKYQGVPTLATIPDTTGKLHIGSLNANYSPSFNGAIDEVSIYNRALTQAEVDLLFTEF